MKPPIRTKPEAPCWPRLAGMLLIAILALATTPAYSESGVSWQALSKEEQSVLAKYRKNWSSLSPAQQRKLRNGARQYLQLPPDKREAVERKHSQYEKMSPREREQLRKKYRRKNKED
ncbi:MAG: DUF3106 domain-containing protein [Gammaproteobacteria bacterium]